MTPDDSRLRSAVLACMLCAAVCIGGVWWTASRVSTLQDGQTEQTDLIRQVLRRIPGMTTFETSWTSGGQTYRVAVTCRENEDLQACYQRFLDAVAIAQKVHPPR